MQTVERVVYTVEQSTVFCAQILLGLAFQLVSLEQVIRTRHTRYMSEGGSERFRGSGRHEGEGEKVVHPFQGPSITLQVDTQHTAGDTLQYSIVAVDERAKPGHDSFDGQTEPQILLDLPAMQQRLGRDLELHGARCEPVDDNWYGPDGRLLHETEWKHDQVTGLRWPDLGLEVNLLTGTVLAPDEATVDEFFGKATLVWEEQDRESDVYPDDEDNGL